MSEVKEALNTIKKALEEDKGYLIAWQANIAMAFKDEFHRSINLQSLHDISNNAAITFMNRLFGSDFKRVDE